MRGHGRKDPSRRAAVLTGVLFIVGTVAGMVSLAGITNPILEAPNYLTRVSADHGMVTVGAFLELVMGVALVGMALAVYPVLKGFSERLAVGYVCARLVEFVITIIGVISLLSIVTLSREPAASGVTEGSTVAVAGRLLLAVREWGGHGVLDVAAFPLGALILNYAFLRSALVPRWLSSFGLVGALLYWVAGLLVRFGVIAPLVTMHVALQAPLGVQEMVLAGWLIVKGFHRSTLGSDADAQAGQDVDGVDEAVPPGLVVGDGHVRGSLVGGSLVGGGR
jgi:hypothetical protein